MEKKITLTENDKELIEDIKKYQEEHGLPSFVATVRKLCKDALKIAQIQH